MTEKLVQIQKFVDRFQEARENGDLDEIQLIREDLAIFGIQHAGNILSVAKHDLDTATHNYETIFAQKKVEYLGDKKPNTANMQYCKLQAEADSQVAALAQEVLVAKKVYILVQKSLEQLDHLSHAISSRLKIELKF